MAAARSALSAAAAAALRSPLIRTTTQARLTTIFTTPHTHTFTSSPTPHSGLDDFFDTGRTWVWTDTGLHTGRAWLAPELRAKSFEDLHKLWWVCVKEQNKLCSQKVEAKRFQVVFPHDLRLRQVRLTMSRIKLVIWERRESWLQAQSVLTREKAHAELVLVHQMAAASASDSAAVDADAGSVVVPPQPVASTGVDVSVESTGSDQIAQPTGSDTATSVPDATIQRQLNEMFPVPPELAGKAAQRKRWRPSGKHLMRFKRTSRKDYRPLWTVV